MNFNYTFTITGWENAVREAVSTYGSGVSAWEIWNEHAIVLITLAYSMEPRRNMWS